MGTEITRKLAEVVRIKEVLPHENADALEIVKVRGWNVVTKLGEFKPGDFAVYFELDSWVPHELAPFLSKGKEPREYNGVLGERLRTMKLRGVVSQGLVLPLNSCFHRDYPWKEGADVTEKLGIQKWEAPIPAQLQGKVRGNFPTSLIPKTDQDRAQNIFEDLPKDHLWEITVKLDGSSMTVFRLEDQLRICSRNLELKLEDEDNTFVKVARTLDNKMVEGYAFQGELIGEGIQKNRENLKGHHFYVYDIYDITKGSYLSGEARREICDHLGLNHVPVLYTSAHLPDTLEEVLKLADGASLNSNLREGIVYKSVMDPSLSFKAISNKWLIKTGD